MPLSREQNRLRMRKKRAEQKAQRSASVGNIAETHNINEGMKWTKEKPMSQEEFFKQFPDQDIKGYIHYRQEVLAKNIEIEREEFQQKRQHDLTLEFGTTNRDCIRWRQMFLKGQKSDFYLNHNGINVCQSCSLWYARNHQRGKNDINNIGRKADSFEELKAWEEMGESRGFSEDYCKGNLMTQICPVHGVPLGKNGCPICNGEPD